MTLVLVESLNQHLFQVISLLFPYAQNNLYLNLKLRPPREAHMKYGQQKFFFCIGLCLVGLPFKDDQQSDNIVAELAQDYESILRCSGKGFSLIQSCRQPIDILQSHFIIIFIQRYLMFTFFLRLLETDRILHSITDQHPFWLPSLYERWLRSWIFKVRYSKSSESETCSLNSFGLLPSCTVE